MPPAAPSSPFWLPSSRPPLASGFPPAGVAAARDDPAIWRPPSPPRTTYPPSSVAYDDHEVSAKRRRTENGVQTHPAEGLSKARVGMPAGGPSLIASSSNGLRSGLHSSFAHAGSTSSLSALPSSQRHRSTPDPKSATSRANAHSASVSGSSLDLRGTTAPTAAFRLVDVPGVQIKRSKKVSTSVASASPAASASGSAPAPLLTAAQKKANHIASEQKRRANIKRGHDQLCEIVPALRDAIAEAERKEREGLGSGAAAARVKKKGKKGKKGEDGGEEKVDGRAGPKSEGTVLLRSGFPCLPWTMGTSADDFSLHPAIEHIRGLQTQRLALLARLSAARQAAQARFPPSDHEALAIAEGVTLREEADWDGDLGSGSEDEG